MPTKHTQHCASAEQGAQSAIAAPLRADGGPLDGAPRGPPRRRAARFPADGCTAMGCPLPRGCAPTLPSQRPPLAHEGGTAAATRCQTLASCIPQARAGWLGGPASEAAGLWSAARLLADQVTPLQRTPRRD